MMADCVRLLTASFMTKLTITSLHSPKVVTQDNNALQARSQSIASAFPFDNKILPNAVTLVLGLELGGKLAMPQGMELHRYFCRLSSACSYLGPRRERGGL